MSSSSSSTSERLSLLATCAPGLEPLLLAELRERGFQPTTEEPGGVAFEGDRAALQRANRELGLALSVLWRLARFKVHDFRELQKRLARLPFEQWLPAGARLRCRAVSRRSRLYHTGALEERLASAVVEKLGSPVSEDAPTLTLLLRLDRERATLSLDTSGEPLYRRGYRVASGPAPLRADIACGLLRAAGYTGEQPLLDTMTGTGTLAIEAVRLARGGLSLKTPRAFAYQQLPGALPDPAPFENRRIENRRQLAPILARDRDPKAVERSRQNAAAAGLEGEVQWEAGALSEPCALDGRQGVLVVANPPHGKRLGERQKLGALYAALGRRTQELGARLALLTSDTKLAAQTGLGLHSALLTDLGGHKVRFYLSP